MTKYIKSSTGTHKRYSVYNGVKWDNVTQQWNANFSYKGIKYNCGYFNNERDAAKARDKKIIETGAKAKLQILKTSK